MLAPLGEGALLRGRELGTALLNALGWLIVEPSPQPRGEESAPPVPVTSPSQSPYQACSNQQKSQVRT